MGVPQIGWFIRENPVKMGDLGVPLFQETPNYFRNPPHVLKPPKCPAFCRRKSTTSLPINADGSIVHEGDNGEQAPGGRCGAARMSCWTCRF